MKRTIKIAALAFLLGCAGAPRVTSAECEFDGAKVLTLVTRVLSDGCTKRQTDEFLVAHTTFLLNACHGTIAACLRRVCVKLGAEDDPEEPDTP